MRVRHIKGKWFVNSKKISTLSAEDERLYVRLFVSADDYGRFPAEPQYIKSLCMPYLNIQVMEIWEGLKRLDKCGLIKLYDNGGEKYLFIYNHDQRIRARSSMFPDPFDISEEEKNLVIKSWARTFIDNEKMDAYIKGFPGMNIVENLKSFLDVAMSSNEKDLETEFKYFLKDRG